MAGNTAALAPLTTLQGGALVRARRGVLLDRAMEKRMRAGGPLSSPFAWRALETVRYMEMQLEQNRKL